MHLDTDRHALAFFLPELLDGGVQRVFVNLTTELASRGLAVDLVVGSADGPFKARIADTVQVVDLAAGRVSGALIPLARYLRTRRPACLVSGMTHANVIAVLAAGISRTGIPVAVTEHCDMTQAREASTSSVGRIILPALARIAYKRASTIIAVSSAVADDLSVCLDLPRDRVMVIGNPVVGKELHALAAVPASHPWFAPGSPPVVLGVGRLAPQKDFKTLLTAFSIVLRSHPARLIVLGDGPERRALEAHARDLSIHDSVCFQGFVQNPFCFMRNAAALVLSSRFEGFGNVLAEAMATGCPVVSTDCPSGPRQVLEDGRYGPLVPVGRPDEMARSIIRVLDHPPPRSLLRQGASRFTIEKIASDYLSAITKHERPGISATELAGKEGSGSRRAGRA